VRLRPPPPSAALCPLPAVKRPSGNKTSNSTTANPRRTHQPAPDRVQFLPALLFGVDAGGRRASALRLPGKDPPAAAALLAGTRTTLPFYRISTTRSPLRRACSMRGHSRSKASIKALVRQLPRRTHIEMNPCAPRKLDLNPPLVHKQRCVAA